MNPWNAQKILRTARQRRLSTLASQETNWRTYPGLGAESRPVRQPCASASASAFASLLASLHVLTPVLTLANLLALASPAPESASAVPPPSSPPEVKPVSPMESSEQDVPQSDTKDVVPTAAPSASDNRNIVRRKLTGYVGFANLPNQWHRKSVRKGFNFNVMVVGKSSFPRLCRVRTDPLCLS